MIDPALRAKIDASPEGGPGAHDIVKTTEGCAGDLRDLEIVRQSGGMSIP